MNKKYLENLLSSLGYQGPCFVVRSNAWYADFWKNEFQISFSASCENESVSHDEIKQDLMEILLFIKTENAINLTAEDNIEELLFNYLVNDASFEDVHFKGKYVQYIYASKKNITYRIQIGIYAEEDYSLDKFEEEHDAILDMYRERIVQFLTEAGVHDFEVEIPPDFLSVKVSIRYNQKIHHLDIHSFYDNDYDTWYPYAARIASIYWSSLTLSMEYLGFLKLNGFCEIKCTKDDAGSIVILAYRYGRKYQINLNIENEVIPFDNLEGHAFERFCADVLAKNGFEDIRVTQGSGDQGVDIIAYKDYVKYGIQCKCYSSDIGNRAVQEVFAGKTFYQCHVGVVLTNRYFTKSAKELAQKNGVILWDRDRLLEMVEKYYSKGN